MSVENKPSHENYSVAIIKPDAFRDYLSEMIISDFERAGLSVIFRKEMILNESKAKAIYSEHQTPESYHFGVKSLLLEDRLGNRLPCMLLILQSNTGNNALQETQKAKGRTDKDGIRAKYRKYFWYELEEMGYSGDELKLMLSRNRLHVPANHEAAARTLTILLTEKDIESIRSSAPEFGSWIKSFMINNVYSLAPLRNP